MKIYRNVLFVEVPEKIKKRLLILLIIENCQRIFILSSIGISFFFLFMTLDYIRFDSGKIMVGNLYFYLWLNHLCFLLFIFPIVLILKHRDAFVIGRYKHSKLFIYTWTLFLGFMLISMAILSFIDRGSLAMYLIYIVIANFGLIMLHWDRVFLNMFSYVVISMVILIMNHTDLELMIINIMEATGATIMSFMVSTRMFNDYVEKIERDKLLEEKQEKIKEEKKKGKALLHNILPKSIAKELQNNGKVKPRHFSSASVMLVDFAGFSKVSKMLMPAELIAKLDYCFVNFDRIINKHRLEKIKTIGDAYLCVGGVPDSNLTHPADCVEAAIEILSFIESWKQEQVLKNEPFFEARVGIHTGPVIAGVVGDSKFAFDVWGDTVNITARVETAGQAGKINISGRTHDLVRGEYQFSYRGEIDIKGYRPLEMYFLDLETT